MLTVAVSVVAVATLFALTALALAADGRMQHPLRVVLALSALLALGLGLLLVE